MSARDGERRIDGKRRPRSRAGGLSADDRAVSESLGYVLVFAVVVASIATVSTVGIGGLQDQREAEQFTNAERAFDVLADNLADVSRRGDPSRATEIRLSGGTLHFGEPVPVTVGLYDDDLNGTGGYVAGTNTTVELAPIVYTQGEESIVYESGALFRSDGESSVMVREPAFVVGEERAALSLVRTGAEPGASGVGGGGTALVVGRLGVRSPPTTYEPKSAEGEEVRLVIESRRARAWEAHFESRDDFAVVSGASTDRRVVVRVVGPDRVSIAASSVRVRFSL